MRNFVKGKDKAKRRIGKKIGKRLLYHCLSHDTARSIIIWKKFFSQKETRAGIGLIAVLILLLLARVPSGLSGTATFLQNNWSGGIAAATTLADQTGWTKYTSPPLTQTDMDIGATVKLKSTPESRIDDLDADFNAGSHNNTMAVGNSLTLNRAGDPQGMLTLHNGTGKSSNIIKDENGGLHIVYHDSAGSLSIPGGSRLKYKFSGDGGQSWTDSINISVASSPIALSEYGDYQDLTIDTTNKRLYLVFRVKGESNYVAVATTYCAYTASGCSSWSPAQAIQYSTSSNQTVVAHRYKYPTIAVGKPSNNKILLHAAWTIAGSFGYAVCEVTATSYCLGSGWQNQSTIPNWDYIISPQLIPFNDALYIIGFKDAGFNKSNVAIESRVCAVATSANTCLTRGEWTGEYAQVVHAIGISGANYLDVAQNGSNVALVWGNVNALYANEGTVSDTSLNILETSKQLLDTGLAVESQMRITYDNATKPYIVYKKNTGKLIAARKIVPDPLTQCNYLSDWKCLEIENGGNYPSVVLQSGNLPGITHFNGTTLRFIATRYSVNGTFSAAVEDGESSTTWKSLIVKHSKVLPAGTSFGIRVRTSGDSSLQTNSSVFCALTNPAPTDGGLVYTYNLISYSCAGGWFQQDTRYFQYQIYLTSDINRSMSPSIDSVELQLEKFPTSAALVSSPYQMGQASDLPAVKSVSWKEKIPVSSNARVKMQVRTAAQVPFSDASDLWYGSGTTSGGSFITSDTTKDANCTRDGTAGNVRTVVCSFDPSNPVYSAGKPYAQYKFTLESTAGGGTMATAEISEVSITYAINTPPSVTNVIASQSADGLATINYSIRDLEESAFAVGLFYDVGLRLLSNPGTSGDTISVSSAGLQLSALIPAEGAILIDSEQIKYYKIDGNSFTTDTISQPNRPIVRAAYGTTAAGHSSNAVVWVRATDSVLANEFSRTAYATGDVGSSVACSVSQTCPKIISWRPSSDIPGSIYTSGTNIRVAAVDGQAVRQLGAGAITSAFTIDTKKPQLPTNPLDIGGNGVIAVAAGLKSNTQTVALTIALPDTSNDNTAGNKMAFCNEEIAAGATPCGSPTAGQLINGITGWTALENFNVTKAWTLMSTQVNRQRVNLAVTDPAGNVAYAAKEIALDAPPTGNPPTPASFTAEDISNSTVGAMVYVRWSDLSSDAGLKDAYGGSDFAKFKIYRAIAPAQPDTNAAPFIELESVTRTSYVDDSVADGTGYNYRFVVEDNVGNKSTAASAGPITPSTSGAPPPPPPTITSVTKEGLTTNSITIKWDTDIPSDSKVVYAAVPSKPQTFDGYHSQGNTVLATSGQDGHSVTLVGLLPSTRYFYEVRSAAPGNNTAGAKNSDAGVDFQFTTLTPEPVVKPQISGVNVSYTHTGAVFRWTTDLDSDSFVQYGLDAGLGVTSTYVGQKDSVKNHTVAIASLQPQTIYYFRLNSTAGEGTGVAPSAEQPLAGGANFSCSASSCSFTTSADPEDTTPPQYSNIQVSNILHNTATITWNTNEPANSFAEFWKVGDTMHRFWPPAAGSLATSHSVQLPFDLEPDTDYGFKVISADSSNNSVSSDEQPPFKTAPSPETVAPPAFTGPTIRHDTITSTEATIYFRTDQPTNAVILYSADNQSYSEQQTFAQLVEDHTVSLVNLTPGTLYYYKVRATNSSGLATESTDCGGSLCFFTTLASTYPVPQVVAASLKVTEVSTNQATISWKTSQPGNSLVEFGLALDNNGAPLYGRTYGYITDNAVDHTVVLPDDLLSNKIYFFRVRTRDVYNQLAVYPGTPDHTVFDPATCPAALDEKNPCFKTIMSDQIMISESAAMPVISGVGVLLVTDVKAVVGWTTDKLADSEVNYGISTNYGATAITADAGNNPLFTRTHAITLEGLQPSTQYYFKVASTSLLPADQRMEDDNGGEGYSFTTNAGTGRTNQPAGQQGILKTDTAPPIISVVEFSEVTKNSALITWNTNEQATSIVKFGEDDSYGRLAGDTNTLTNNHQVRLQRLDPGTAYHFQVVSYDREGNGAASGDYSFTTLGIKGEEDEEETSEDEGEEKKQTGEKDKKGKDEVDEAIKRIQALTKDKKISVEKIVELLKDFSEDDISKILSSLGIQLLSPPKFMGGAPKIEVTTDSAIISWQTDKEADSRVAYAAESFFQPNKDDPYQTEAGDAQAFTTDHKVVILGLQPNTVYHYQLRSRERAGRTARSFDRTFKTLPLKPEISNVAIVKAAERNVTLSWKTNVPTKSVVEYTNLKNNAKRSQGDPQLVTAHQFTLSDLAPDSRYSGIIRAEEESGLTAVSKEISFATTKDTVPPEIIQVRTDVTLSPGKSEYAQAIITWRTNEEASSQVLYEEGITQSDDLKNATEEATEYLLNHVIVLNKLRAATVYRFRVVSADPAGNKAVSRDYTLLTPQKKETVLEIIIKNFEETFGFLKSLGR